MFFFIHILCAIAATVCNLKILSFGELVLEGKLILRAPLQDSELSISETFISAVYSIKRVENQCDVEESREESKTEISRFGSLDRYKGNS